VQGEKVAQKAAGGKQAKAAAAAAEELDKMKPNWAAAGDAFWTSMGVTDAAKPARSMHAPFLG